MIFPHFTVSKRVSGLSKVIAVFLLLYGLQGSATAGIDGDKTPYIIPRSDLRIIVDGDVDEEAWANAWQYELNYEVSPGENTPAPVRTVVLVTYDNEHVYFGFRCYDPEPSAIRAHLGDRDHFGSDDWVGVVLDTFNDERRDFLLLVNPMGVQLDYIETTDSGSEWDAIWDSAARITDWGWSAEMKVPFRSLRFQRATEGQVWGFDAVRGYPRNQFRQMGAFPRDRNNNCYQCQLIKIRGFEGVSPGRNLEIIPTVTAVTTDERKEFPGGDFSNRERDAEAGATLRWGMTPNLTLSSTVNPDFSQVEADAQQLDINEPFALFYEEKRPFFMEGSDFFETRFNTVYTRTMRDPDWGLKLTGKEGDNTLGAYVVRDNLTNLIFPGSQGSSATSLANPVTASVFRYKRDLGNKYTLGALLTDREGDDYFNRLFGFDGTFRMTDRDLFQVQLLGSSTSYPDAVADAFAQESGEFGDRALDLFYMHHTRNYNIQFSYRDIGEGFRADLGFIPQVGFRYVRAVGDVRWFDTDKWWTFFLLATIFQYSEDQAGDLLDRINQFVVIFNGAMQSGFEIYGNISREVFNGREHDIRFVQWSSWMQPHAELEISFNGTIGDRIDYANSRLGQRINLNPSLRYNLGRHLLLTFDHTYEKMSVQDEHLYTANISQGSIVYQFNTRLFIRSILQYVDFSFNVENYTYSLDPEFRHLFTQFLLSYKINPQTVLFIGYTDNYLGNQDFKMTQSDRTFFMKIGYAWQL